MEVPTDIIDRCKELYDQGLYLQAYALTQDVGPLADWRGVAGRVFAGRLAANLGAFRLAQAVHLRVGREAPDDPLARYYAERAIFGSLGPFTAWERQRGWPQVLDGPEWLRADWLALEGALFARLRDFERADRCLDRALELAPERAWVHVERAFAHELADRYGEALASAQEALALHPWYRPAVQAAAEALVQLGRDDDAVALLTEAGDRLESHLIAGRLANLLIELERYPEADTWLERHDALAPLAERRVREWAAGRRATVAHALGDRERAIAQSRLAGAGFHATVAERMASAPADAGRVRLAVGFVRQHHMTCAPATLAAMARYWQQPADHLQIADAICYDGTSSLKEREWSTQQGYVVREFRVTWAVARELLDRGIPFALTTFEPGNAHLQAVIGYDDARGTLLVRDPSDRESHELLADPGLDRWQAQGPRGMCAVPAAEAHRLEGCTLPDAELYDIVFEVHGALDRHEWEAAQAAVARLEAAAPGHRLTWQAKATCAGYAGNRPAQLQATDRLRKLYPDDPTLSLVRLGQMRDLYPRRARVEWLRDRCYGAHTHPGFWRQYAQELCDDGRTYGHAEYWLRRSLRAGPSDGVAWYFMAGLWWRTNRRELAREAYRIASRLTETDEDLARAYFTACRHFGAVKDGLRFLEDRVARLGEKSSGPALTLAGAYRQLERLPDALRAIDHARATRPEDPVLDLELAEYRAAVGDGAGADELWGRARGQAWPIAVERTAAVIAQYTGDRERAATAWRRVLEWQPLAMDAIRGVARAVALAQGDAAAIDWLRERARAFPAFAAVRVHLAERLAGGALPEALGVLREAAALDDADGWIRREIVDYLARLGRFDEAFAEAEAAAAVEPEHPSWYAVYGALCARADRPDEARAAFRAAVERAADNEFAINRLCGPGAPAADREAQLRWVASELERQYDVGDGLWAWAPHARDVLPAEDVLRTCQRLWAGRPELWQTWSVLAAQYRAMDEPKEALEVATRASERFSKLPRAWVDLADAHAALGNREGQIAALQRAHALNPSWVEPARKLGEAYEANGDWDASVALFRACVAVDPDNAGHHGWLAEALWNAGEREAALDAIVRAVECHADYPWAWRMLDRWAGALGARERAVAAARAATEREPREAAAWMAVAHVLKGPEHLEERLAACTRATELAPHEFDAHDLRAWLLGDAGRWDEALAATRPPAMGDERPVELRGREGWVLGQQGRHAEAIAVLEPLVAEAPDYYWAWQRLSDYREAAGDLPGALAAAEAMVRIAPGNAIAYGYRANAHRVLEHAEQAQADFAHAFELDPEYEYAGMHLFDDQLERGDLEGATATLDRLYASGVDQWKAARRVQLCAQRDDRDGACAGLRELFGGEPPGEWASERAVEAVARPEWLSAVTAVYGAIADRADGGTFPTGVAWTRALAGAGKAREAEALLGRLTVGSPTWRGVADQLLRVYTDARDAAAVERLLRDHHAALQADPTLWGLGGYALTTVERNAAGIRWLAGWDRREGREPWMLLNLSLAHRCLNQPAEARAVGEAALRLPPDHTTDQLRAWVACDRAVDGDVLGARELLDAITIEDLAPHHQFLHQVADAVCNARGGGRTDAAAARRALDQAWETCKGIDRLTEQRHVWRRAAACVARLHGGLAGRWWGWRRWWRARG